MTPSRDHVAAVMAVVRTRAALAEAEIRAARGDEWKELISPACDDVMVVVDKLRMMAFDLTPKR